MDDCTDIQEAVDIATEDAYELWSSLPEIDNIDAILEAYDALGPAGFNAELDGIAADVSALGEEVFALAQEIMDSGCQVDISDLDYYSSLGGYLNDIIELVMNSGLYH